jgi:hypothetical protein
MHDTWRTLLLRVSALLRAKQYVVFFSIALYAFAFTVPLVSSWVRRDGSLGDALDHVGSVFVDAGAERSLTIFALALAAAVVTAFFRAGYIRSIVGRFHPGPRDTLQFGRLLALQFIIEALVAAYAVLGTTLADTTTASLPFWLLISAALLLLVAASLALAYADYAVVISGIGPWHALKRSLRVFRLHPGSTVLVILAVRFVVDLGASLAREAMTGLPQALPVMVIEILLVGLLLFIADVVLIVVYLVTMESGRLKEVRRGR